MVKVAQDGRIAGSAVADHANAGRVELVEACLGHGPDTPQPLLHATPRTPKARRGVRIEAPRPPGPRQHGPGRAVQVEEAPRARRTETLHPGQRQGSAQLGPLGAVGPARARAADHA